MQEITSLYKLCILLATCQPQSDDFLKGVEEGVGVAELKM